MGKSVGGKKKWNERGKKEKRGGESRGHMLKPDREEMKEDNCPGNRVIYKDLETWREMEACGRDNFLGRRKKKKSFKASTET